MGHKTTSIRSIFIICMIIMVIFQSIFFICTIVSGGIMSSVANYSYEPLLETTELRKEAVEAKFNNCSNLLTTYNNSVKNRLQEVSARHNDLPISELMENSQIKEELFTAVIPDLKSIAATDGNTGAFIILDYTKDITAEAVDSLYIRSSDNSANNGLSVIIGSESYLNLAGIEKNSYWRNQLNFTEMDTDDFYTRTLELGTENKDISTENLGYWSNTYDINNSNVDCIAYTIPLRDSAGVTYGVLGIEMSLSYLQSCLPYFELNSKGQGSYVIGVAENVNDTTFTAVVTSGDNFNKLNRYAETFDFGKKNDNYNIYTISPKANVLGKVYATKDVLNINTNAQYTSNAWVLSGVVESIYLLSFLNNLKFKIILAFAITAVASIIFAWFFAKFFAKPIYRFIDEVKEISPANPVIPEKIYISEFNELGGSIERLTKDLSDFSAKASLIINMAGVPVGAFEYDRSSDVVFCTDLMMKMLGLDSDKNQLYVSKTEFEEKFSGFLRNIQPGIDKVYKITSGDESKWMHVKTDSNNNKILGTVRDVTAETLAEQKRIFELERDALTGLLNRETFCEKAQKRIDTAKMGMFALMVINMDDVSYINKEYGTITGDLYIKAAAEVLLRYENQFILAGRAAGDEFFVLMAAKNQTVIMGVVNKIKNSFKDLGIESKGDTIPLKFSAGIAYRPKDAEDFETLIEYAEFAMNSVKRTTKNDIKEFSIDEYETYMAAEEVNKDIEDMIISGDFSYAYQPIVDTSTGEIYGYEALMRPNKDFAINTILDYAVEQGLNYEIEKITWLNSLKGYTQQVDCLSPKKIFINSMSSQLLTDEDIAEMETLFPDHLDNVVLEVLEGEQIDEEILNKKRQLKEKWNCMIALDDYGSGYSNDNTLLSVKPDLIKLDIELVTDIERDADRQSLVKNIVSYAHNRNIKVLAEGIENKEQMYSLLSIGVDLLQGFYLAMPDTQIVDSIDPEIKEEIVDFDPNNPFMASVGLTS